MTKARHEVEDAMVAELGMSFHRARILLDAYKDEVRISTLKQLLEDLTPYDYDEDGDGYSSIKSFLEWRLESAQLQL